MTLAMITKQVKIMINNKKVNKTKPRNCKREKVQVKKGGSTTLPSPVITDATKSDEEVNNGN